MKFAPSFSDDRPFAGIVLMMIAASLFAALDATAKYLGQSMASLDVAWLRYAGHAVLVLVFVRAWANFDVFRTKKPILHLVRGLNLLLSTVFNFWALRYLQLAEASAIMFCSPLLVTALAGPMLGEPIGLRRWIAVGVGFVGVLVVTRPGTGAMHWAVLLSGVAVLNYACYAILTRRMNRTESAEGLLLISALVGAAALAPVAPSAIGSLSGWTIPLAFMLGLFGATGHYALVVAHRVARASIVAPFMYTQMVWMILLGYLIFQDTPDPWTLAGTAIIASAGLYILHRERVRGKPTVAATNPVAQ